MAEYRPIYPGEPEAPTDGRADTLVLVENDHRSQDSDAKHWQNQGGQRVCGARLRSWPDDYRRCAKPKTAGRCHLHGGSSPKGADHPNFRHGRYSTVMPQGLQQRYTGVMTDPELVSSRREIGLVTLRIELLLEGLDPEGLDGAPPFRSSARVEELAQAMLREVRSGEVDLDEVRLKKIAACAEKIAEETQRAASDERTWKALLKAIGDRRRLVDSEAKRTERQHELVTMQEMKALLLSINNMVQALFDEHGATDAMQKAYTDGLKRIFEQVN